MIQKMIAVLKANALPSQCHWRFCEQSLCCQKQRAFFMDPKSMGTGRAVVEEHSSDFSRGLPFCFHLLQWSNS